MNDRHVGGPDLEPRLANQCAVCGTVLAGPLGYLFRIAGITRSPHNPNLCNRCNTHAEEGRLVELSVLFADLCSFTELTQTLGPEQTHRVADAFLKMATNALVKHDAFIDKYLGDAVMAFFNVPLQRDDHSAQAVAAAVEIQARVPELQAQCGLDLKVGVGVATGWASVGWLGSSAKKDYTAIGDVVNLASRLEGQANPGEIVVSRQVYETVAADFPHALPESLRVKGFREPILAYRLQSTLPPDEARAPRAATSGWQPALPMGVGATIFAILGAPCAAGLFVSPLAMALGIGAYFGALMGYWGILDGSLIHLPLLTLATLASLANLYTLWRAHRLHRQARGEGPPLPLAGADHRGTLLVLGLAITTLLVVLSELHAHAVMHE